MVKREGGICKNSRRRKSYDDDDDDGDEEYVLEEDEEEEDGLDGLDGSDFIVSSAEDERPKKIDKLMPKWKGRKRSQRRRARGSDCDDEEFLPEEEEGLKGWTSKGRKRTETGGNSGRKRRRVEGTDDFVTYDDDFVEERIVVSKRKKRSGGVGKRTVKRAARGSESLDTDVSKQKKRGNVRKTGGSRTRRVKRLASESEASDSDYVASDDSDDDNVVSEKQKKSGNVKKTVVSKARRVKRTSESDYVNYDDDDDDDDISVCRKQSKRNYANKKVGSKTRSVKRSSVDSEASDSEFVVSDDDDNEEEEDDVGEQQDKRINDKKIRKTVGSKTRKVKRSSVDSEASDSEFIVSDDDDNEEDDDVSEQQDKRINDKKTRKTVGSKTRKVKRSSVDSGASDSEFIVSDDDDNEDEADVSEQQGRRINDKKTKKTVGSKTRRVKRSLVNSESSDSEYNISEDDDNQPKKRRKVSMKRTKTKKSRSSVDVDYNSSDFDDLVSEEEIRDLGLVYRSKKANKKRTRSKRSRPSDGSSDSDDMISEEEIRDLSLALVHNHPQPKSKKTIVARKGEEKGKEKEADEQGKQVCGICLSEEQKGIVRGVLSSCAHYFCFACIMEWSKVESRCPVCKGRFVTITKSGGSEPVFGMRKAVIKVEKRDQVYQPSEEELRVILDPYEDVVCMECQQGGDDSLMLLCDICDSSAHTYCVGLGREVPEGNWYCECCRSVGDGLSHSQDENTLVDQGTSNDNLFPGGTARVGVANVHTSTNSPQSASLSGRFSSQRFDLNASPRDFSGEDHGLPGFAAFASQGSGFGASTLFARRARQQHIRTLLSNSRPRQMRQTFDATNMPHYNIENDAIASGIGGRGETYHVSGGLIPLNAPLSFLQWQQNGSPVSLSNASLTPCRYNEGSSFRTITGAKEQVQSLVNSHLRYFSADIPLEQRSSLMEISRRSTHTILAACGIEHQRSMVSAAIEPPNNCSHDSNDGQAYLVKGCCSSCFNSYVKDVVLRLMSTS